MTQILETTFRASFQFDPIRFTLDTVHKLSQFKNVIINILLLFFSPVTRKRYIGRSLIGVGSLHDIWDDSSSSSTRYYGPYDQRKKRCEISYRFDCGTVAGVRQQCRFTSSITHHHYYSRCKLLFSTLYASTLGTDYGVPQSSPPPINFYGRFYHTYRSTLSIYTNYMNMHKSLI